MPFPEPPENRKLSPAIFRVTRAKAPKLQNPTEFSYLTTQMNRILRIPPNGISYPPKNFRKQPSFPEPRGALSPPQRNSYAVHVPDRRRAYSGNLHRGFRTWRGYFREPAVRLRRFSRAALRRLFWGAAFLISEYVCGFFALGRLLVWAAPLICGLGTGAALAGAFTIEGMNALRLAPGCAGCAAAVIFAAGTSSGMSSQLLRLVSSDKNSIVSTSPAAGEYTLRFLVYLAILSACAIAEAALRCA